MNNKLLVKSLKDKMVMDYEAMKSGIRRYVGYEWNGEEYVRLDCFVEVDNNAYYRKAIKVGDLKSAN